MMKSVGHIELPAHAGAGGFDHAAVDRTRGLCFVAHTSNDAVDVIGTGASRYLRSIAGLKGVAGALVDEPSGTVFTSNRGENTLGILRPGAEIVKVATGARPNGLAFDPQSGLVLCANVGDPGSGAAPGVTLVDQRSASAVASLALPGRTRWTIHDEARRCFFVNVADPPRIAVISNDAPHRVARWIEVPARGPHGLDLDRERGRLYCACDDGRLVALDARTGAVAGALELSGAPDVIFLDAALSRLYVAIGDPGVIDVVDVAAWRRREVVPTERGAHTLALDESAHRIYAFLPETHRAALFEDRAG